MVFWRPSEDLCQGADIGNWLWAKMERISLVRTKQKSFNVTRTSSQTIIGWRYIWGESWTENLSRQSNFFFESATLLLETSRQLERAVLQHGRQIDADTTGDHYYRKLLNDQVPDPNRRPSLHKSSEGLSERLGAIDIVWILKEFTTRG